MNLLCNICNQPIAPGDEVWSSKLVNHYWCYEESYKGSLEESLDRLDTYEDNP